MSALNFTVTINVMSYRTVTYLRIIELIRVLRVLRVRLSSTFERIILKLINVLNIQYISLYIIVCVFIVLN